MKKKSSDLKELFNVERNENRLTLTPLIPITVENSGAYDKFIRNPAFYSDVQALKIELASVSIYDTYIILFINTLKEYTNQKGIAFELVLPDGSLKSFIEKFSPKTKTDKIKKKESAFRRFFVEIGNGTKEFFSDMYQLIAFFGEIFIRLIKLTIKPSSIRWKDFPFHFTRSGVNALFICLLIMVLLGLITGYQGALQLKQFGADIYIADLVGVSIARELSPLMVAILVAGRSGSAFAAEIGTMKVSDEIDALKSMGYDEISFLVLPRVLSVTFAMPILTMFGDLAGISGGLIAALSSLNITLTGFMIELQNSLGLNNLLTGLFKSMVFGFLIASIGCFRGLQVRGGAESVGKYTTMSVVSGILLIIVSDAVFTFLFQIIGI